MANMTTFREFMLQSNDIAMRLIFFCEKLPTFEAIHTHSKLLTMMENPIIERLPKHLKAFIIPQNYERYTPQDQAVWRFVMRQNVNYLW